MKIREYRILLPITAEECRVANLWTVAKLNIENTGGGEGVVYLASEEFHNKTDLFPGCTDGHYSKKLYQLKNKIPKWVLRLVPKDKLELYEESWTSFPYSKSIINNPEIFKEKIAVKMETIFANDKGTQENAFRLPPDLLRKRDVVYIDITDPVPDKDYKESEDPSKFVSKKTGRGPLRKNWKDSTRPIMCVYKLITANIKIFGFQRRLEKVTCEINHKQFHLHHRRLFCWIDDWYGMTYEQVRKIQEDQKQVLKKMIDQGQAKGDSFEKETGESDDESAKNK